MDRTILVEELARAMRPQLFKNMDRPAGPATRQSRDDARRDARAVIDSGLMIPADEHELAVSKLRARVHELEEITGNLEIENRGLHASIPRQFGT